MTFPFPRAQVAAALALAVPIVLAGGCRSEFDPRYDPYPTLLGEDPSDAVVYSFDPTDPDVVVAYERGHPDTTARHRWFRDSEGRTYYVQDGRTVFFDEQEARRRGGM